MIGVLPFLLEPGSGFAFASNSCPLPLWLDHRLFSLSWPHTTPLCEESAMDARHSGIWSTVDMDLLFAGRSGGKFSISFVERNYFKATKADAPVSELQGCLAPTEH
jgi:hypothetical protein